MATKTRRTEYLNALRELAGREDELRTYSASVMSQHDDEGKILPPTALLDPWKLLRLEQAVDSARDRLFRAERAAS